MAKIQTVKAKEDFIVQLNGDYNVIFAEVIAPAAVVSGQVVQVGTDWVIAAAPAASGAWVRAVVRGNPTTINKRGLTIEALTADAAIAALEAKGLVFVDGEVSPV